MEMKVKVHTFLRVRSAPSLEAPSVDALPNKTVVNVTEQQGEWSKISAYSFDGYVFSPCDNNSWVYTKYLRKRWRFPFLKLDI